VQTLLWVSGTTTLFCHAENRSERAWRRSEDDLSNPKPDRSGFGNTGRHAVERYSEVIQNRIKPIMETFDLLDSVKNTIPAASGGIELGGCSGAFGVALRHGITVRLDTAMTGYPPYGLTLGFDNTVHTRSDLGRCETGH